MSLSSVVAMATVSFISGVGCGASLRKTLNKPLEVFGFYLFFGFLAPPAHFLSKVKV